MSEVTVDPENIIRVMPETLANKIAAGEVVQRPASAVKELLENAIDAGADQVTVVLKGAGSELIQIIDNGCGMGPADAALCFRRHATSKIQSVEDLERIRTLGFRGEALASIASVAQVELRTKRRTDAAGFLIRLDGGRLVAQEPCATPEGTSVAVRNLFYNVPARRNFLKTPATEFKHIVETFQFLALSNPEVGFTLLHEDNEVYRLTPARREGFFEALRHRIGELLGSTHAEHLIPVEETTSYLTVRGFVSRPTFHRRSRGEQFLFVNGRFIKNRSLDHAVLSGFEELVPEGSFPFYTLFLEIDPRHVDVNVHPTKAEVKFDDERGIYGFVRAVVKKALGMADLTPQLDDRAERATPPSMTALGPTPRPFVATVGNWTPPPARPPAERPDAPSPEPHPTPQRGLFGRTAPGELSERLYAPTTFPAPSTSPSAYAPPPAPGEAPPEEPPLDEGERLMWQLHDRYILTQIRSGLMLVDQQAAHERILYEKALQSMQTGFGLSQQLLFPHTVAFSPADYELLKEMLPDLRSLGFDLELFSGRSIVIRGVPNDIRTGDERTILEDILQQFKSYRDTLQVKGRDNLAKSIARRSAIPAGKRLSTKEMRSLIDQLFLCGMPYACPHGRPTMIKISIEELDKRFGRTGG